MPFADPSSDLVRDFDRAKFEHMFWYSFKKEARDYLAQVNREKKVRRWIRHASICRTSNSTDMAGA